MDASFLKFWGEFWTQVADGTRQAAELARWIKAGFSGAEDLAERFRCAYGLDRAAAADSLPTEAWTQATARFQGALAQWVETFDGVPRQRYEALREEKETLEKKLAASATTIADLRLELARSRLENGEIAESFRQLMAVQHAQFDQLSENLKQLFIFSSTTPSGNEG